MRATYLSPGAWMLGTFAALALGMVWDNPANGAEDGKLKGKRVAILLTDGFEQPETRAASVFA